MPLRARCWAASTAPRALCWAADRKSTRLNSSHLVISYAVFCLKKKQSEQIDVGDVLTFEVVYDACRLAVRVVAERTVTVDLRVGAFAADLRHATAAMHTM